MRWTEHLSGLAVLTLTIAFATGASGQQVTFPPRPAEREFIVDEAGLLSADGAAKIKAICSQLLTEKKIPVVVVTINSMADYGAGGWDIRAYAQALFDNWGIGFKDWNYGMLLLISKGDRRATIELGAAWAHGKDAECRQIMDHLVTNFKKGMFSEGILAGVEALDGTARGLKVPRPPRPWWHHALVIGFFALAAFTIVSLIRNGSSGWAWVFWGVVFAVLGIVLYTTLRSRSTRGWGGGSFGGGFSGGGGASGSW